MSTAAITPEVTVTTPEVTVNNTAAEILASHTAEKAQAAPVAEALAAPTTPAPVPVAKPYEIIKGTDGSVEVKFNEGGQIFKGTMDEVLEKIAESKLHANQRIKELSTKTPEVPATPQPAPAAPVQTAWVPDEAMSVSALNNMLTGGNFGDAVGIGLAQMFGTNDPGQVKQALGEILQLSAELKGQRAISEFAQKAPDFPWAEANTTMLLQELQARGLPATTDNLVFTHQALKGMGKYQAVVANPAVAETPNPPPPNGGNPPVKAEANPWTMPLKDLEADIRAGR